MDRCSARSDLRRSCRSCRVSGRAGFRRRKRDSRRQEVKDADVANCRHFGRNDASCRFSKAAVHLSPSARTTVTPSEMLERLRSPDLGTEFVMQEAMTGPQSCPSGWTTHSAVACTRIGNPLLELRGSSGRSPTYGGCNAVETSAKACHNCLPSFAR
jgi:hypothetical protein